MLSKEKQDKEEHTVTTTRSLLKFTPKLQVDFTTGFGFSPRVLILQLTPKFWSSQMTL